MPYHLPSPFLVIVQIIKIAALIFLRSSAHPRMKLSLFSVVVLYLMKGSVSNFVEELLIRARPVVEGTIDFEKKVLYPTKNGNSYLFQLADPQLYATPKFYYDHDEDQLIVYIEGEKFYLRAVNYYLAAYTEAPPYNNSFSPLSQPDGSVKITQNPNFQPNTFVSLQPRGSDLNNKYVSLHSSQDLAQPLQQYYLEGISNQTAYHPTTSMPISSTSSRLSTTSQTSTSSKGGSNKAIIMPDMAYLVGIILNVLN